MARSREDNLDTAQKFCTDFNLALELTTAQPELPEEWVRWAKEWEHH